MREVAIGEVCELINGRAFKPSDWSDHGLPIVRIQNLNNEDAPFNRYSGEVRDRFLIDSGALLFSWSGTPGTSFGAFFWHRGPAILNQHIFHVLPTNGIEKRYLRYALNGRITRIIAQAHGGVGLQHITKDKLETTTIPLPSLADQRLIANMLDKAEAIRRKRKQAIALTEELLRSTFLDMFGDPVSNPRKWPLRPVTDLCASKQYGTAEKAKREARGLPMLRMNNLTYSGDIDLSDLKWVELDDKEAAKLDLRDGDVLFNRVNSHELVGKTAVWHGNPGFTFAGYLIRLRPCTDLAMGDYIAAAMNMPSMKRTLMAMAKPSINMANISGSDLDRLFLPTPPLEQQTRYVEFRSSIERLRKDYRQSDSESETLFHSLVSRSFNGCRT